jgi:hypothetical protein
MPGRDDVELAGGIATQGHAEGRPDWVHLPAKEFAGPLIYARRLFNLATNRDPGPPSPRQMISSRWRSAGRSCQLPLLGLTTSVSLRRGRGFRPAPRLQHGRVVPAGGFFSR